MSAADVRPLIAFPGDFRNHRELAFRAIERVLREDPVLASIVETWRSREGSDDDMQPPAPGMMPIVSLSPLPIPSTVEAFDLGRINFAVGVQLFVQGTCSADILGLWGAIEDAIVRSKPFGQSTVGEFLCSCLDPAPKGVNRLVPVEPAFFGVDLARENNNPAYQSGSGRLLCFILRPA